MTREWAAQECRYGIAVRFTGDDWEYWTEAGESVVVFDLCVAELRLVDRGLGHLYFYNHAAYQRVLGDLLLNWSPLVQKTVVDKLAALAACPPSPSRRT